ncbi:SET domain-containing protein 4-like [Pollicipes pollicipes]|uniref:SET domain-containing protein 4-like n=1 Tax=Pollicipes pollicipes TaxID=41117 RepID=UPI001884F2DF|nr:SET domain-containing protein 4-like [Pollicipes pollicipes]
MAHHEWEGARSLVPTLFPATGRGLMARSAVRPGATLVSVPRRMLITSATALASELGPLLRAARPPLSGQLTLTLFLLLERRRGADSAWRPYLDSLPAAYTTPAFCHFRHAWFTVNTRAVFLEPERSQPAIVEDTCALAPFLDLFNHAPDATMRCRLSPGGCYELVTEDAFAARSQVFINYGPHDSLRLLLEYGFVVPDNERDAVPRAQPAPSDALRACTALLDEWRRVLACHVWVLDCATSRDGRQWTTYGTRLGETVRLQADEPESDEDQCAAAELSADELAADQPRED